jgi:hypothetical protein
MVTPPAVARQVSRSVALEAWALTPRELTFPVGLARSELAGRSRTIVPRWLGKLLTEAVPVPIRETEYGRFVGPLSSKRIDFTAVGTALGALPPGTGVGRTFGGRGLGRAVGNCCVGRMPGTVTVGGSG